MANRYGLRIRAAMEADAPGVAALVSAATGRETGRDAMEARLAVLRRGPGIVLLAEEWGPPSGLIVLIWRPILVDDAPLASIDLLIVAPGDRRRGIGRLLLKAGAQAARAAGCDDLVLAVPDGERTLEGFGAATGFSRLGALVTRPLRKRT